MTVLVAYATSGGSTAEIAGWIAEELRAAGHNVEVRAAAEVPDAIGYSGIVLGGAVYAAGWHPDARHLAHRLADHVRGRAVWLFSSGPLDDSANTQSLPPSAQVARIMRLLNARGHATFGGRLSEDANGWLGLVARRMARDGRGGDFRDPEQVREWARSIAAQLSAAPTEPGPDGRATPSRRS
jgi:menaquinone-dependent protoporphyrinogen oxidase